MTSQSLAKLQELNLAAGREEGHQLKDGIEAKFYMNVSRSRDRYLLFKNGRKVGYMDSVVPYNIFSSPYKVFNIDFSTETPFDFEGISWEENPYPDENKPMLFFPYTLDYDAFLKFIAHVEKEFEFVGWAEAA